MRITTGDSSGRRLPPLAMYDAPTYTQYQQVASVAAVPLSLPRAAYHDAITPRKKAYHQFAWAAAVAREIYFLSEPDFLSSRHIPVMAEQLVSAHKTVYGSTEAHAQYDSVQAILKGFWSRAVEEDYNSNSRSYKEDIMGWINGESREDCAVCLSRAVN